MAGNFVSFSIAIFFFLLVTDWDLMEKNWNHCYTGKLQVCFVRAKKREISAHKRKIIKIKLEFLHLVSHFVPEFCTCSSLRPLKV